MANQHSRASDRLGVREKCGAIIMKDRERMSQELAPIR